MQGWPLALLVVAVSGGPSDEFADALVQCIRNHANKAADAFPLYGDVCMAPTAKIDIQVIICLAQCCPGLGMLFSQKDVASWVALPSAHASVV